MSLSALGLDESATEEDVKAKYRELAHAAHPDKGGSVDQFHALKQARDQAIKEVKFGQTMANARLQLNALREAARGTPCPRCDGEGYSMRRMVGFREMKTVCKLCHGKGKIQ